jgi:hypothetical protein
MAEKSSDVWKAIIVSFILGSLCASAVTWAIGQRNYRKSIDTISRELDASIDANRVLQEYNNGLTNLNTELGKTVARLRADILKESIAHRAELDRIKATLGTIGTDLTGAGTELHDVIEGISEIIILVESL